MYEELANLNFKKLLFYQNIDGYSSNYKGSYDCTGFCTNCEDKKLLKNDEYLSSISHGADSNDFRSANGKVFKYNLPVMFIFMDPSPVNEKNDMGHNIVYNGCKKFIPNSCYYWINENINFSISSIEDLINSDDLYSAYIFYLINKYELNNIYVTNMQKCLLKKGKTSKNDTQANCVNEYLYKEIKIFKPKIFLCFGIELRGNLCHYLYNTDDDEIVKIKDGSTIIGIKHPGSINYNSIDKNEYIKNNDLILEKELKEALVKYQNVA